MNGSSFARRWFRFSLRTMLVLVAILCCWLAWERSIVRQRQELRKRVEGRFTFATRQQVIATEIPDSTPGVARVSLVRRWLGDEPIQQIHYLYQGHDEEKFARQIAELERVFPEAELINIGSHAY